MCAGAGGQALGLERAGFEHEALVERESAACSTLRINSTHLHVVEDDLGHFDASRYKGIELVAGRVPRPPFLKRENSVCDVDERNLSPDGILFVKEIRLRAVMIENVRRSLNAALESRSGVATDYHA